jgi:hypothetical protein
MSYDPTTYLGSAPHYRYGRPPYSPDLEAVLTNELGLDGNGRLLDVGCGPGILALRLAGRRQVHRSRYDRPGRSTGRCRHTRNHESRRSGRDPGCRASARGDRAWIARGANAVYRTALPP